MERTYRAAVAAWKRARLRPPRLRLTDAKRGAFEALLDAARVHRTQQALAYTCPYPRHEFLRYLVAEHHYLLHGSREPDIAIFEPRPAEDLYAFSAQRAVYAASDGIWPMVFAIRDRRPQQGTFFNGCSRIVRPDGTMSGPYYHFAMAADGLRERPWVPGTIYVLPRETFVPHPHVDEHGLVCTLEEWASPVAVVPLAKLAVTPSDFPFLDHFWGYDPARLSGPHTWTDLDHTDPLVFPICPAKPR